MSRLIKFTNLSPAKFWIAAFVGGILSLGLYVYSSAHTFRVGFPLDDAWIHQTYARNLADGYGWTFLKGETSGGSTSPLWTVLISLGYRYHLSPLGWVAFLGGMLLLGCVFLIKSYIGIFSRKRFNQWLALLFLFEWHFVWAALSGMETILSIFLVILLLVLLETKTGSAWGYGLFLGVCVWVRPDLITLAIPIFIKNFCSASETMAPRKAMGKILRDGLRLMLILGMFLGLYLFFNWLTGGNWMPTTFYAKQAEYRILKELYPYWRRFLTLASLLLVGIGAVLLPGFLYAVMQAKKQKDWGIIGFFIWILFYIGMYAVNLAVTYQHGRYMMPVMAAYYLVGIKGAIQVWEKSNMRSKVIWMVHTTWKISLIVILFSFYVLGARAYAKDVGFVESQMVDTAKWVKMNIPTNQRVAVHDIGAMGYYGNHLLIDLGGLIDPAVIPFIRNEKRLAEYMNQEKVHVLVCFPGWYPQLTSHLIILHQADSRLNGEYELGVMTIYQWSSGK